MDEVGDVESNGEVKATGELGVPGKCTDGFGEAVLLDLSTLGGKGLEGVLIVLCRKEEEIGRGACR